jgi:hypothetical protein
VQLSAGPDLRPEASVEPIMAWRAWALTGRRDGTNLLLRPVAGRSRPWRPREQAEAGCKLSRMHASPHPTCSCGLHGTHGLDVLRRTRSPAVLGRVALWGKVVEHELGYRAEFAYPQSLRLICRFCLWQWGAHGSRPDVVAWFPRDELVPLCWQHVEIADRYGMRPRRLLAASEIEIGLRETYVVDALAI